MRKVVVDKIASVALAAELGREIRVSPDIPCEEGVLIAAEVLNNKSRYNKLELTSGRMAQIKRGDVIVGALGHRKALFGYSGRLPEKLEPGDKIQLLNLGGVLGVCDSMNPNHGRPFDCRVLGVVLDFPYLGERIGVPARVAGRPADDPPALDLNGIPVVAFAGTCMNSGKTAAVCAVVSRFCQLGLTVDAFKATGVALQRDILVMEDAGARNTGIFSDHGIVCTTSENAPMLTRKLLSSLSGEAPDAIVFELGDGLLGAYGVEAILMDPEVRRVLSAVVLSANDPVAAWGGVKLLRDKYELEPAAVTGPATDNQVGIEIIRERMNVPAANALTHGAELGDLIHNRIGFGAARLEDAS
ncbi:MAG: hypothetical protein OXQ29_24445 [Rhodospirillaceae bacterium]|nr:hypothetical protein [Rhodospirillaceae bacterium]